MSAQPKPLNTPNTRKAEGVESRFPNQFHFRAVRVVRGCRCLFRIEFTDDAHEATGAKLYLQLKSGDSYLRERKRDGAEIFTIKDERHARYWMALAFPVLLVIRHAEGEVRWTEVREWLKRASENGRKSVNQIVFAGERVDAVSVQNRRKRVLSQT